uniref:F-box associated beta-propeller type 1 domain-containing protein n=1 Tax=Fagus sylvatica TaxID=28930 RepID=A0A2N9FFA3_FAGSY
MSESQPRRKPKQLSFPDDVVFDILTRVPVKSVIRFSIKKFKICAGTNLTRRRPAVTVGLAYHSQNNDFKILRIQRSNGTLFEAEVYTLSTDSWRKVVISVDSLSGSIDRIIESPCLLFNGALHTIAYSRDHKFILSFDVNDEIFQPIMLPQNYTDIIFFESLAVFKGLLALFVYSEDPDVDMGICYIWVMREYGVVESWTRKSVPVDLFVWSFFCTDSGELLINTADRGVISYDPESLNEKYHKIRRPLWLGYTADLMESLVLLDQRNLREATNTSSYARPLRAKYPSLPSWEVQVTNDSGEGETMIVPCSRHVPYVPWTGAVVEADFLRIAIPLLAEQGGKSSKYHKES